MDPQMAGMAAQQGQGQGQGGGMDPGSLLPMIGMAVLGYNKSKEDAKNFKNMMTLQAAKERWSPWTGQVGRESTTPSAMGEMMKAILAGAVLSQQMKGKGKGDGDQPSGPSYMGDAPGQSSYQPWV